MNRFPDWPSHMMAEPRRSRRSSAPRKTIREASRAWSEVLRGAEPDLAAGSDVLGSLTQEPAAALGIGQGQPLAYSSAASKPAFSRLSRATSYYRSSGGSTAKHFMRKTGDTDIRRKTRKEGN